jgi:transposase
VSKHYQTRLCNTFQRLVQRALKKEDRKMARSAQSVSRGKPKRSKAHNLLRALNKYKQAVLAFIVDPKVPFGNNQAERDLRMIKTKQKISGCFRSTDGGNAFCRIRSYLSVLKKNKVSILQGIKDALNGKAYFPVLNSG